jgi:hypothetical protein
MQNEKKRADGNVYDPLRDSLGLRGSGRIDDIAAMVRSQAGMGCGAAATYSLSILRKLSSVPAAALVVPRLIKKTTK